VLCSGVLEPFETILQVVSKPNADHFIRVGVLPRMHPEAGGRRRGIILERFSRNVRAVVRGCQDSNVPASGRTSTKGRIAARTARECIRVEVALFYCDRRTSGALLFHFFGHMVALKKKKHPLKKKIPKRKKKKSTNSGRTQLKRLAIHHPF